MRAAVVQLCLPWDVRAAECSALNGDAEVRGCDWCGRCVREREYREDGGEDEGAVVHRCGGATEVCNEDVVMRAVELSFSGSWRVADNSRCVAGMRGVSFVNREVVVRVLGKLRCVWLFVGRGCQ